MKDLWNRFICWYFGCDWEARLRLLDGHMEAYYLCERCGKEK